MADQKTTQTGATPEAKPEKKKREVLPSYFPTAKEAETAAAAREKGPRRAFTCIHGGKEIHVVANNEGRAGGLAFSQIGGQVTELGSKTRAPKQMGVDGIMAAVNALPEAERAAVLAQLKHIGATKK